ncbi:MAG TPA: UDP-N-acetylmuramoyl-tripeptide--D-alanyl-D-alanine ligase [Acidimicrobiales bacterium]|nr:UDP-N-acetylmuramoyl-tripeptide--D-alanyl-D-alanine ligase [Acidimicrobiales bacterium]
MVKFLTSEIASVADGAVIGDDVAIDGATHDSRALVAGQLFVAMVADRDGHDFIGAAVAAGAPAYVSERGASAAVAATAVLVDSTRDALAALGEAARNRMPGVVIGVTGSVGKTSTKDLIASVFAASRRTFASEKSFNNELGVPLTLINAPDDVEVVVVEIGARGLGHIAQLCAIARPTIGVVTAVGDAHVEQFGSVDAVAQGKGELIESLPDDGVAILNAADPRVLAMARRTRAGVVTFGEGGDVVAGDVVVHDDLTSTFTAKTPWGAATVVLGARGAHNIDNALAALAVAGVAGVALDAAVAGLRNPRWSPWRMELHRTRGGARVVNDSYNANPTSMAAALRALAAVPARRRLAVLGVMAELGAGGEAQHRAVRELATSLGIDVLAVAAPAYGGAGVGSVDEALDRIGEPGPDDAILVKGSRVAGLDVLAARLLER